MTKLRKTGLFVLGVAGLALLRCASDPLNAANRENTAVVTLSSSYAAPAAVVRGDTWSLLSIFPPCRRPDTSARNFAPSLSKTAAASTITPFKEARVMVLNGFNAQRNLASAGKADFYCAMTQSNVEAFVNRKLDCWNDLVSGLSRYLSLELVHTGMLKSSGGYLDGDILVRPGTNIVLVCFIDEQETIIWTMAAEYIYQSSALANLLPSNNPPLPDGWLARTQWNELLQRLDTTVWEDRRYLLEQVQDSAGMFNGYVLPRIGPIGYTQAYADEKCTQFRQSIPGPAGRKMRKITTTDRQGQISGVQVTFTRDYYIDTTEVTQAEYQSVMGSNPSAHNGDLLPVENVSWFDAVRFCIKLSGREKLDNCYDTTDTAWTCDVSKNGYRLPTEAEWLFAYQAGSTTKYFWGDIMDGSYVWYGDNSWIDNNSNRQSHPVAQKLPNGNGLYDIAGNVWEWCHDWTGGIPAQGAVDYMGPTTGGSKVMRGGCFGNYNNGSQDGTLCFSINFRYGEPPATPNGLKGFRCVRTVSDSIAVVPDTSSIAWLTLDSTSMFDGIFRDSVAGQFNGTMSGPSVFTKDRNNKQGGALWFDGSSNYLDLGQSFWTSTPSEFTVCLWVRSDSITGSHIAFYHGYSAEFKFTCTMDSVQCGINFSNFGWLTWTVAASMTGWNHLAITYRAQDTIAFYCNGLLRASSAVSNRSLSQPTTDFRARIGAYGNSAGQMDYFRGSIDDLRVYSSKLDARKIQELGRFGTLARTAMPLQKKTF